VVAPTDKKIEVVLLNLGGPSERADIEPFLFNFFMDKNIIGLPYPLRWLVAKYVSRTRAEGPAREAYAKLGYKSPLLDNTFAQAMALKKELQLRGIEAGCLVSMRYWHPLARDVVRQLSADPPDHLVLLPMYPQYSTTTTGSSFENFFAEVRAANWAGDGETKVSRICCYPVLDGFIKASADHIRAAMEKAPKDARLLLSAHGLPEKIIAKGDPYQKQCEETAAAIVKELNIPGLDWQVCYQSRVGPLKWIGPSIDEALQKAAADKKGVVVYPHAFVSEHVETLVELDMEYKHAAQTLGVPYYGRAQTAGAHPAFIAGLAQLVQDRLANKPQATCGAKICGNAA
jgi:protoporphyrin/coproporphyrin ferrochelatase